MQYMSLTLFFTVDFLSRVFSMLGGGTIFWATKGYHGLEHEVITYGVFQESLKRY